LLFPARSKEILSLVVGLKKEGGPTFAKDKSQQKEFSCAERGVYLLTAKKGKNPSYFT